MQMITIELSDEVLLTLGKFVGLDERWWYQDFQSPMTKENKELLVSSLAYNGYTQFEIVDGFTRAVKKPTVPE